MPDKGKGRQVRQTKSGKPDFKQMDFEEAKAFFYDMHTAELKAQGKGLGQ